MLVNLVPLRLDILRFPAVDVFKIVSQFHIFAVESFALGLVVSVYGVDLIVEGLHFSFALQTEFFQLYVAVCKQASQVAQLLIQTAPLGNGLLDVGVRLVRRHALHDTLVLHWTFFSARVASAFASHAKVDNLDRLVVNENVDVEHRGVELQKLVCYQVEVDLRRVGKQRILDQRQVLRHFLHVKLCQLVDLVSALDFVAQFCEHFSHDLRTFVLCDFFQARLLVPQIVPTQS